MFRHLPAAGNARENHLGKNGQLLGTVTGLIIMIKENHYFPKLKILRKKSKQAGTELGQARGRPD